VKKYETIQSTLSSFGHEMSKSSASGGNKDWLVMQYMSGTLSQSLQEMQIAYIDLRKFFKIILSNFIIIY